MRTGLLLGILLFAAIAVSIVAVAAFALNYQTNDAPVQTTHSVVDVTDGAEDDASEQDAGEIKDEHETDISGDALEQASAAALVYIGEGRVTDSEIGDADGYYEIEITLPSGREVDVHLDENFNVISTEYD